MRVLSWNILHGGGTRCDQIVEVLRNADADVVALQEFRHGKSKPILLKGLRELGHSHVYMPEVNSTRENSILLSSRYPLTASVLPLEPEVKKPVSGTQPAGAQTHALQACIELPSGAINIAAVHFPQKKAQIPVFSALQNLPASWLEESSLLIGDFNCGIPFVDSETKTFYATHMFQQLLQSGWQDAWRNRHGDLREYTWISTRKTNGFRYDHALVSEMLDRRLERVFYDHTVRERKISDHSLLIVDLQH